MLQQYCLLQSFNNNTVNCSSKFCGGLKVFNPVTWVTLRGFIWLTLLFFEEHVLVLWLSILVSWLISIFVVFNGGYEATHLQVARVPLLVGGSIPCQRGRQVLSLVHLDMGGTCPFHSPHFVWPCLP